MAAQGGGHVTSSLFCEELRTGNGTASRRTLMLQNLSTTLSHRIVGQHLDDFKSDSMFVYRFVCGEVLSACQAARAVHFHFFRIISIPDAANPLISLYSTMVFCRALLAPLNFEARFLWRRIQVSFCGTLSQSFHLIQRDRKSVV